MPRVRFAGFRHASYYRASNSAEWLEGEIREVSDEEAARLVASFGREVFEVIEAPKPPPKRARKPRKPKA